MRGAIRALGHAGRVTSPTFTVARRYEDGRVPVSHLDLYRLEGRLDAEDPALLDGEFGAERINVRRVARGPGRRRARPGDAAGHAAPRRGRRADDHGVVPVNLLAFDTATAATTVALRTDAGALEARDDPPAGARPRHTTRLLALAATLLDRAGLAFAELDRIAVGVGPGSFTGLRVGLATARALALATGAETVGVSTLRALALPAEEAAPDAAVLAVLDARRGEAFVAAWRAGRPVVAPRAAAPERIAALAGGAPWLGVGDGAIRFRAHLEPAGVTVPEPESPLHRVSAAAVARLGAEAEPGPVAPEYLRAPDAAR